MTRSYFLAWGAALLIVFGAAFWVPAHYDDVVLVLKNPLVTGPWPGFKAFFLTPFAKGEYEPLNILGHWVLFHVGGEAPFVYRLTSLLLHAANSLLVFALFRRLLGTPGAAFCGAVLFSLYPAHVEVLALSSFKKHLGVAFFGLVLLNRWGGRWGGWAALGAALLCKESALVLPVLSLILEEGPIDRLLYGGLAGLSFLYVAVRLIVVPRILAAGHGLVCLKILSWYLAQLFWPSSLCLEHSLAPAGGLLLCALGLGAVAVATVKLYQSDRIAWRGVMWCLVCLLPFLDIVPFLNYSLVADRYLYLASAGFFLCAVRLARFFDPRAALAAFFLACAFYGGRAAGHMASFTDPWTLWTQAVACAPDNPRAHVALAFLEMKRMLYAEAAGRFEGVLARDPDLLPVFEGELAIAYAESGRLSEASRLAQRTARERPSAQAFNNLGTFHMRARRWPEARTALEHAATLDGRSAEVALNLGTCQAEFGRFDAAQAQFKKAAEDPSARPSALRGLGELYAKKGRAAEAQSLLEQALALNPMSWETARSLARLHRSGGNAAKSAAVLDAFLKRLEPAREALKRSPAPQDRQILAHVERLRAEALLDRDSP